MLVGLRLVKDGTAEGVRQELHIYKMPGIVVGILVPVTVAQFFHEFGGRIADGDYGSF